MKINNKGITLVELLTVLIVLILIFLLAVTKVNDAMDNAEQKSIKASSLSYIKAVNDVILLKNADLLEPLYEGYYTYEELDELGVRISGTKPLTGYLVILDNRVTNGCLKFKDRRVIIKNGDVDSMDTKNCKIKKGYNSDVGVFLDEYSGREKTFTVQKTGKYKLEVWGAQGGSYNETYFGGYGGYSKAIVNLNKDDVLYINVGGKGVDYNKVVNGTNKGGYNGGGDSYTMTGNCGNYGGSGGGATSIAYSSGLIKNLEIDDILIIAGGGGGSIRRHCSDSDYNYENGGSGGGYIGGSKTVQYGLYKGDVALGGTQTLGGYAGRTGTESGMINGSYGQGGQTTRTGGYTNSAGGGGGLYGGGNGMFVGASGGSGYIGNENLTEARMYCYECRETDVKNVYTISTDRVSEKPINNTAKKGNGYVRITLIEESNSNN
ncbi:MAG: hypothetical protein IKX00_05160 [Bacilli bacterium]|nr:hypothetical protein [Bacilli bacterium]